MEKIKNVESKNFNRTALLKAFRDGIKTEEPMEVADFAENFIYLPENSSMPGLINLDITPYFRKPLNDLTPGNGITRIAIIGCVQIGKSTVGLCFGLAMMKLAPGNTMFLFPRNSDAEDFSQERLTPMIKASPVLRKLIKIDDKSSDNKILKKTYKGGYIYFASASSAANLRSKPIRYLYRDELDEYKIDPVQGDPLELSENRTVSFRDNKKIVDTSTPTDENSLINKRYEKGTKEEYHVPCPFCGFFQTLNFHKGLKFEIDEENKERFISNSIYYECEECKEKINEKHKQEMLKKGKWIAQQPGGEYPSYRLNALYSPFISWSDCVSKYLDALKDKHKMRAFVNTYLGEIYEEEQVKLDALKLYERGRNEPLSEGEIHPEIILLTGAVDTQKDRLVIDIKGWGPNEKCWTVFYREISGQPGTDEEVWNTLKEIVNRPYMHPSGVPLYVKRVAIDAGGSCTQTVYDFCSKNPKFLAIMGSRNKQQTLLAPPKKKDIIYKGTYRKDGIELTMVGTEIAKEDIYSRLLIEEEGARYCYFNKDLEQRYYEMLTAEKLTTVFKRGYPSREWVLPSGKRNEALDTFVYNYAMAKGMFHVDLYDGQRYKEEYFKLFGNFGNIGQEPKKKKEKIKNKSNYMGQYRA